MNYTIIFLIILILIVAIILSLSGCVNDSTTSLMQCGTANLTANIKGLIGGVTNSTL